MENNDNQVTRKNFVLRGLGFAALLAGSAIPFINRKKKNKTVKMLSQDGKLVEIDEKLVATVNKKKITDAELKAWVHQTKKTTL